MILGGSGGKCGLHTNPMFYEGFDVRYTGSDVGVGVRVGGGLVWHTCVCLIALHMQWM